MDPTLKTDVANVRLAFPDKLGAARLPNVSKEPISCAWFRFLGGGFENDAGLLLLASQKDPRKPSLPIFPARADYVDGPPRGVECSSVQCRKGGMTVVRSCPTPSYQNESPGRPGVERPDRPRAFSVRQLLARVLVVALGQATGLHRRLRRAERWARSRCGPGGLRRSPGFASRTAQAGRREH